MLRYRAARTPNKEAFFFTQESGDLAVGDLLTYGELDAGARRIGGWLRAHLPGGAAGRPVVLAFPPGLEFAMAYFGCLYAGAIAVPAPPPDGNRLHQERVERIVADCAAAALLTDTVVRFAERPPGDVPVFATGPGRMPDVGWEPPALTGDDLAMLQYTSGSTSEPKGVMLTHGNVLANLELISRRADTDHRLRVCGWLPFHHDMGLTQLLSVSYVGGFGALMSPTAFLKRPHRWLHMVHHFRGDIMLAPNFAYDLCARRIPDAQLAGVDLSSVRLAMNGAEPIAAQTIRGFATRFAPLGFRPEAAYPCYGMAEATLFVTGGRAGEVPVLRHVVTEQLEADRLVGAVGGAHTTELVGSGQVDGYDLRIVDTATGAPLPPGRIGEIWVRGPSIGRGYWNRPAESADTFDAHTPDGEGGFLRTGDLGGLLDGELFVTGRRKEMLIVHGRNLYPQDIERAVRALHPALDAGLGAAFAVADDDPRVVVVQEVRGTLPPDSAGPLVGAIQATVSREFGIKVAAVALLRPGQVPRTTSGKVQRRRARELFLAHRLTTVHEQVAPGVRPAPASSTPPQAAAPAR
ncbi:fatty acyl-AMP ligase [Asanoa sp. WMMD1127]|uniref:fatty acyl-AMP ligase n=1 Tax=Asanoa sp. WMMD1127 TaxID=3016107 RepID=UPI002416DD49|nr:fatty acyl-AMP ligase [Asanoa sp. WMMD1127]MDG4820785.1 fatty acyl-AMP ligase [Asanoa sp. WMMD1127]